MKNRLMSAGAIVALALGAAANADTVATFADPASGPTTPLFQVFGPLLTGGWSLPGLNLLTPGTTAPDYTNVTFSMTPLLITPVVPGFSTTNGGTIDFFTGATLVFEIQFDSGFLTTPTGFGGSDFVGQNVRFSGPALGGMTSADEAFAFSFANPVSTPVGYTVTSAFTSSAQLRVPGPASLAGLGAGLLVTSRRRRRA